MSEAKISVSRKIVSGTVVSNKMDKTAVVQSQRKFAHPVYKKYVSRRVKYKVHDEQNTLNIGDEVKIIETRPLSRGKRWKLLEILVKTQKV